MLPVMPSPSPTAGRASVLLVEDHQDTRQMYAEFLSTMFEVWQAGDGLEGLEAIRRHPPDLVITDLSLPGLDGFELVNAIRSDPSLEHIPVICLSGYGGHAHEGRAREAGCNTVLQKPCMPDALAEAVASLLRDVRNRGHER
jgi:CheY-like chemotaxis protein